MTNDVQETQNPHRRDFLHLSTIALGTIGTGAMVWPLIHSMSPSQDVLALQKIEVDLSLIPEGTTALTSWQNKPLFIKHRTQSEIDQARADDVASDLKDPQNDEARAENPKFMIVVGVCTHLGCTPSGANLGDKRGDFDGWYCGCHGSHYDNSGRIRKGPAPENLAVPPIKYLSDTIVEIG